MTDVQELINAVTALGVSIRADGVDIKIRPTGVLPAELKDRLRARKLELLDYLAADAELQESMRRLDSQRVSVAIREDGTARIIHTDGRLNDGETRYQPQEMLLYVTLSQSERRLLHSFKRTFGGSAEVQP